MTQIVPSPDLANRGGLLSMLPIAAELGGVVLLAGAVRQSLLSKAAGRSRMDLPFHGGRTIGSLWFDRIEELRRGLERPDLPLFLATNTIAGVPADAESWACTRVCLDSEEPRGSGGALRDIVLGMPQRSRVLVVPGHAILMDSLGEMLPDLAVPDADAVVHTTGDGTPTGIFMLRRESLAALPAKGFIDLKEQGLPAIARHHDVRVVATSHTPPLPIRTLDDYIEALRTTAPGQSPLDASSATDWRLRFSLAERGAQVDPTSRLHDSVVLSGGVVKKDAVLVRSLVGPGGVVDAGRSVFDEFVTRPEEK